MAWWAAIPAFAGLISGTKAQGESALDAAEIALEYGRRAREAEMTMFREAQAFLEPYRTAGLEALPELEKELYSPDYNPADDYVTQEDLRRLKMRQAASGKLRSGTTARKVGDIYSNSLEREYNKRYERILSLINAGAGHSAGAAGDSGAASGDIARLYVGAATGLGDITNQQGTNTASLYAGIGSGVSDILQDYGR